MEEIRGKLLLALTLLAGVFLFGIAGYVYIEHWPVLDAVYMTVITLGSVGYGETNPLTTPGRVFTIVLILTGLSAFVYATGTITAFLVEGEIGGLVRRRRMQRRILNLSGHYIVCGAGAVGSNVVEELAQTGRGFVIIDSNAKLLERLEEKQPLLYLAGQPSDDDTLKAAGIERAAGLVAALESDKDNLFVVVTARALNPRLRIVTRAHEAHSVPKLQRGGADAVVSTEAIGGMRMASELVRPTVVSFLDTMLRSSDAPYRFEEVAVSSCRSLAGKSLAAAEINRKTGLMVLAVKNAAAQEYTNNPPAGHILHADDVMIVLGDSRQLAALREL
ncbi:MAG TPA: potassium channel protein [bacterium]|nr:potassium channel protein [bacterium]